MIIKAMEEVRRHFCRVSYWDKKKIMIGLNKENNNVQICSL